MARPEAACGAQPQGEHRTGEDVAKRTLARGLTGAMRRSGGGPGGQRQARLGRKRRLERDEGFPRHQHHCAAASEGRCALTLRKQR